MTKKSREMFAFTAESQRTQRKANLFVGEPFDKLKALSKVEGIPTNKLHSSPAG
jgi:hypothetical protein